MSKSFLSAAFLFLFLAFVPANANADPISDEWQAAITGQIEAFRASDGSAALSFAAAGFKARFADPDMFVPAIREWGYSAIVDSRSHSFGAYQVLDPNRAMQAVTFTGPDQALYQAIYQLEREEGGWRIGGVQMMKTSGMGA
jgi:hypothetical protein